jgi:Tfp pilus assembly pilus retraction ATPase PilT
MHVALQLGNSGIRTYATLHSTGAASTVERVLTVFPKNEREERAISLMHNLRLIVSCKLVPSTDGKRIQLREYLPFSATTRAELLAVPYERWPAEIQFMTQSRGQTFAQAARRAAFEDKITPDVLNKIQVER